MQSVHNGDTPLLNVKVLASCPGDASMRQALEAVIISNMLYDQTKVCNPNF